jgi:hypothetical protein
MENGKSGCRQPNPAVWRSCGGTAP